MAFFNDLSKKLSQAGQATMQKTKELADVAKLNSMISDEEKRINQTYTEIGKLYFEHHAADSEEIFTPLIQSIHAANEKIADLKNQAAAIKGIVKCEKCGAEVAKNAAFCGACGNPMPTAEAAPAAQEQTAEASQITQEAAAQDSQTTQEAAAQAAQTTQGAAAQDSQTTQEAAAEAAQAAKEPEAGTTASVEIPDSAETI